MGKREHLPEAARFWQKVEPSSHGCWLWSGGRTFKTNGRGSSPARVAWELAIGSIPPGLAVLSRCGSGRKCVRPSHHFLDRRPPLRRINNAVIISILHHRGTATVRAIAKQYRVSKSLVHKVFTGERRAANG